MGKDFEDRDMGYEELKRRFKGGGGSVKVGILRGAGKHADSDITIAKIAAFHEFGTSRVPERSFLRSTMDEKASEIASLTRKLNASIVDGKQDQAGALGVLGAFIANLFRKKINSGLKPPLKPATIRRKGSSKPLIDTGQLINSIDYEVEE